MMHTSCIFLAYTAHAGKMRVGACAGPYTDLVVACAGAASPISTSSPPSCASVALPFGAGPFRLPFFGRPLPLPVPFDGVFATPGGAPSFFGPGCLPLFPPPAGFFGFIAASASVALCVTPVIFAVCERVTRPSPPRKLSRTGTGQQDDELLVNKFPPPLAEQHHVKANMKNKEMFFNISSRYLERAMADCYSSLLRPKKLGGGKRNVLTSQSRNGFARSLNRCERNVCLSVCLFHPLFFNNRDTLASVVRWHPPNQHLR
jgi:hypothetical protein